MRLALALLLCAACLAEAQGQGGAQPASPKPQAEAGPKPSFEVATIKRNVSVDASGRGGLLPSGVFRMVNVPVSMMIMIAYRQGPQLYPSQIIGGPDWLKESYDITAKVGSELQGKSQAELLRAEATAYGIAELSKVYAKPGANYYFAQQALKGLKLGNIEVNSNTFNPLDADHLLRALGLDLHAPPNSSNSAGGSSSQK